ncbi:hypothetical protein BDW66DRAFT_141507 [Aspergillus desertorum]
MLTFSYSGVAVGSSIGHAIGGLFSGGGSSAPAEAQQAPPPAQAQPMDNGLWQGSATNSSWENPACATDVQNFRKCMDENQGNMSICGWYLDQLVCSLLSPMELCYIIAVTDSLASFLESLPGCCQTLLSAPVSEMNI